jgi:hypothetical protein
LKDKNSLKDLGDYENKIPTGKYIIPVLDENLNSDKFKKIYLRFLGKIPVIGFLGREPTDKNIHNLRNFLFIGSRENDRIIRITSDITRKTENGKPKPFLYRYMGFDVFSFTTRRGDFGGTINDLEIIKDRSFVKLIDNPNVMCKIIPENRLIETVKEYDKSGNAHKPCAVYNIIEFNTEFEQTISKEELAEMLKEDIKFLIADKKSENLQ